MKKRILYIFLMTLMLTFFSTCFGDDKITVMVAPFINRTEFKENRPENNYVGLGFAEEVLKKLSGTREFEVTKIEDLIQKLKYSQLFGNSPEEEKDLIETLSKLNADFIVLGSYTLIGEELSLTVKVYETTDHEVKASETQAGKLKDWNEIRGLLITKIAKKMGVNLSPEEEARVKSADTKSLEAFRENYVGLMYFYRSLEEKKLSKFNEMEQFRKMATCFFKNAIGFDNRYADAKLNYKRSYRQEKLEVIDTQGKMDTLYVSGYERDSTQWAYMDKWLENIRKQDLIKVINNIPEGYYLEVQGFSENREDFEISTQRALWFKEKLIESGVFPNKVNHKGYGSTTTMPWIKGDSEVESLNRRIVFKILPQG
jgi:TolB-like protein